MIEPKAEDIGRKVIYTGNRYPGGRPEEGVITSFNHWQVFVRYGSDFGAKATSRSDLEWAHSMIAPVLAPERDPQVPSCGYFTGETTPAGCQALMRRYRAAIKVVTAASALRHHVRRSLDVGPRSKDVSKETALWRQLTETIEAFNKESAHETDPRTGST